MLTDQLCQQIAGVVNVLQQTHPRRNVVKDGRPVRENLEDYFARILRPQLQQQFPDTNDVVRQIVGLMAYLGPPEAAFPPSGQRDELIDHARNYANTLPDQKRLKRLVELTLAYGCRWRRLTQSDMPYWNGCWPGAFQELTDTAYHFVVQTVLTLSDTVRGFTLNWDQDKEYAGEIASEFTGRGIPGPDEPRYRHYQTIQDWDPPKGNLYGTLKRAIRGGGGQQGRLQPNWFSTGLLFKYLKEDVRLDVGKVAFQQCLRCPHPQTTEYDGGECKQGHAALIVTKVLLWVPGVYKGKYFRRCPGTDHYYDFYRRHCPHCNKPGSQGPTTLLVRGQYTGAEPPVIQDLCYPEGDE